jgi:histidine triad (HIT) family protein
MDEQCVFCRIVAGKAPAHRVFEDDTVVAFLDIRPINKGHTLVIPKRHAPTLADLPLAEGAQVFAVAQRVAVAMRGEGIGADGANVVINDGKAAFQTVPHTHIHVLPRHRRDVARLASNLVLRRPRDLPAVAALLQHALGRQVDS